MPDEPKPPTIEELQAEQRKQHPVDPGNPYLAVLPCSLLVAGPVDIPPAGEHVIVTLTVGNGTLTALVKEQQLRNWARTLENGAKSMSGEAIIPARTTLIVPGH